MCIRDSVWIGIHTETKFKILRFCAMRRRRERGGQCKGRRRITCELGPVSYTHLDVYKRQDVGSLCSLCWVPPPPKPMHTLYTNLHSQNPGCLKRTTVSQAGNCADFQSQTRLLILKSFTVSTSSTCFSSCWWAYNFFPSGDNPSGQKLIFVDLFLIFNSIAIKNIFSILLKSNVKGQKCDF